MKALSYVKRPGQSTFFDLLGNIEIQKQLSRNHFGWVWRAYVSRIVRYGGKMTLTVVPLSSL
ncbi:MAG: hypothetical protein CMM69_01180 [Rhodospirillaceae bacterium]|nr:hypothetical protein [Rhodospirillaceae bacterium]OUX31034.1 MAG: hypothetical protein CBE16_01405 [Rhodospirillaceae bacterium TMED256]